MLRFATLAFAVLASASLASAAPYINAFGGMNVANDFAADSPHVSFDASTEAGYVGGLAVGAQTLWPGFRVELEASWRHNELNGILEVCGNESDLSGSTGTFAAMLNIAQDVHLTPTLSFHVLGGAGYGARRIVLEPTPENWQNTSSGAEEQGFVWQLGAGFDYALTGSTRVGIGYRYFMGPSTDRVVTYNGKDGFFESDGDNHALIASVMFAL